MTRLFALALALSSFAPLAARADSPPPAVRPAPPPPSGDDDVRATRPGGEVSREAFVEKLTPYGRWVNTPEYGSVFVPSTPTLGWRPYAFGHWALTDWGWTWVSDEPWGWATYHYGRWYQGSAGWFWIPGRRWAPAWVSWRWNYGYVAWAPLAPRGVAYYGAASPYWVTVRAQHFTQPIRTVALTPTAQAQVVAQLKPLGGAYSRPQQGIFGPPVGAISKATGQQLRAQPVGKVVPGAVAHASSGNPRANPPARAMRPPGSPRSQRGSPPKGPPPSYRGRGKRR